MKLALIECADGTLKVLGADGEIRRFATPLGAVQAHAHEAEFLEAEVAGLFDAINIDIHQRQLPEAHHVA